ncbi:MAG: hypothetical protein WA418_20465, partial [Bradyrhizobium sp.]
AQQRTIGPDSDNVSVPVAIQVDGGPIQGRRLVQAMLAREAASSRAGQKLETASSRAGAEV